MSIELIQLCVDDGNDIYQMLQEIPLDENGYVNPINGKTFAEYKEWLIRDNNLANSKEIIDGWKVPSSTYWLTILEQSAPKLCADRIDYTLRDMYHYGFISKGEINRFLKCLDVIEGEVIIKSIEISEWFVDVYYKEVIGFFMHPLNVYAYDRLSKSLKLALDLNEITLDDLLKEDKYVFGLLKNSNSVEVLDLVNSINREVNLIENKEEYDIFQKSKLRLIDPTIFIDGQKCKTSEISCVVKTLNEKAIKKFEEGLFIKIEDKL